MLNLRDPSARVQSSAPIAELTEETLEEGMRIEPDAIQIRDAVQRIGGWRTDLGKLDNTLIAGEDHEVE